MAAQFQGGIASNNQCRVILLLDLDCFYCENRTNFPIFTVIGAAVASDQLTVR